MKKCNIITLTDLHKEHIENMFLDVGFSGIGFTSLDNNDPNNNNKEYIISLAHPYNNVSDRELISDFKVSKYAWGNDYHNVISDKISSVRKLLNEKYSLDFEYFIDVNQKYDERKIAQKAGLGFIGRNKMLITNNHGTYVFLAVIIAKNFDFVEDIPNIKKCLGCNKCITACPGQALTIKEFNRAKCVSHITQLKSEFDIKLIKSINTLAWGCDICQDVCPHNKDINNYNIEEFKCDKLNDYSLSDIINLTDEQYDELFKHKPYKYKGLPLLKRNCCCIAFNNENYNLIEESVSDSKSYKNKLWAYNTVCTISELTNNNRSNKEDKND